MFRLLVIEPNDSQAEIFNLSLSDFYVVERVSDFEEGLALLKKESFDIIISDWQIKDKKATVLEPYTDKNDPKHLPITVVVTANNSEATMRNAYSAGISYVLPRPYKIIQFSELLISLRKYISVIKEAQNATESSTATRTALNQAAIYGTGMELISTIASASSPAELAGKVLRTLKSNGIIAAVQFRMGESAEQYDHNAEPCDVTTTKVFNILKDEGRIYRFGRRIMFNDKHVSLLIIQINQNDPTIYDDVLDMGAKLVPSINNYFQKIHQQRLLDDTNDEVKQALDTMHKTMLTLGKQKRKMIDNVAAKIHSGFHELDLTEEQEKFFIEVIEKELESRDSMDLIAALDSEMTELSERLNNRVNDLGINANESGDEEYQDLEFF